MSRDQTLVCTADRPDGWCHSTMSGGGVLTLSIYRTRQDRPMDFDYHPKWHGKRWKYRTFEQLEKIKDLTDRIGLSCGSLSIYTPR